MKLYHHIRSSASYRVRIALNLKQLDYDSVIVNLMYDEQFAPAFVEKNPARLVPVLEDGEACIAQSLAIIEYLDEQYPEHPLLPRASAADRAWVRQLALAIACDIHPLNNLRVLKRLGETAGFAVEQRDAWAQHWIGLGFAALESELASSPRRGLFCYGDTPTLADVLLIPQMLNAARVQLDTAPFPTLRAIEANCAALPAFAMAHPVALESRG